MARPGAKRRNVRSKYSTRKKSPTPSPRSSPEPTLPPDDGRCAFQNCPNPSTTGLFSCPNPRLYWDRFVAWTRASGNPNFEGLDPGQIASRLRACERHFPPAAVAIMKTGGGDRAGVVPNMNLPPPLDIDFGVDVPGSKNNSVKDRNENSLVDVIIKTELGSDDEFEEPTGGSLPQLTPAPQISIPEPQKAAPQIKLMPKPPSSLFPPKLTVAPQKTTVTTSQAVAKSATSGQTRAPAPFPLLILNGMPAGAQAAHIMQAKPPATVTAQRPPAVRSATIAPAQQPTPAPVHTECSKLIKDLLEVQKETFELEKQRLDIEKQRLEFERMVGSQLLTLIPAFTKMINSKNFFNGRKRKASDSLDASDPKSAREMLGEEEEDIKEESEEEDGSVESDSGVVVNEGQESEK